MAKPKRLPRYIEPAEVHQLLDCCLNDRDRMLVDVLWHTGARISEALALRVGDIGQQGLRMVNLKQHGDAEKFVIVQDEAFMGRLRAYCEQMAAGALLFPGRGDDKPLSRQRAWVIVKKAAAGAGVLKRHFAGDRLRPVWPHTLRHSHAVHLLLSGVPITVVQEQLGHASLDSTQVYTSVADPGKEKAIAGVTF